MFTIFIYSSTYRYKIWEIKIFTIEDLDDYLIFNNGLITHKCIVMQNNKQWRECEYKIKKSASKYYKNINKLFVINKISMVWLDFLIHYLFRQQNT